MAFESLPDRIAFHAATQPARRAIVCDGTTMAWGEFGSCVDEIAGTLASIGLKQGDNVVLLSPLSMSGVIALFGILRAGGCLVPLPTTASNDQLQGMARDSSAKAILAAGSMKSEAEGVASTLTSLLPQGLQFLGELPALPDLGRALPAIGPDDPFNVIYSSGTTGNPKGIIYSHALRSLQYVQARAAGLDEKAVSLVSTPLYSNTTLAGGLLQLAAGGTLVLLPKFDARSFLRLCSAEAVTHATLVPVQCQRLLACPELEHHDLSRVTLRITAAPMTPVLKQELASRLPGKIVESYGFTELGAGCVLDLKAHPGKLHTVGRPREGIELKIIDEDGHELAPGGVGEVVGRSSAMMRGYYGKPELTQEVTWMDAAGRTFLRSGDIGKFDEDGFLSLVDRKKDVIISGGFNIYPADIEAVVAKHAQVSEVAVIGVPSKEWGESPVALVVPRAGASTSAEELRTWANAQLGKTQRLAAVEFCEQLARNSVGKLLKREMRERYWSKAGASV